MFYAVFLYLVESKSPTEGCHAAIEGAFFNSPFLVRMPDGPAVQLGMAAVRENAVFYGQVMKLSPDGTGIEGDEMAVIHR